MRHIVSGVIGLLLGCLIVVNFLRNGPQGQGAYAAGQLIALAVGVLLLLAGIYYLVLGIRTKR